MSTVSLRFIFRSDTIMSENSPSNGANQNEESENSPSNGANQNEELEELENATSNEPNQNEELESSTSNGANQNEEFEEFENPNSNEENQNKESENSTSDGANQNEESENPTTNRANENEDGTRNAGRDVVLRLPLSQLIEIIDVFLAICPYCYSFEQDPTVVVMCDCHLCDPCKTRNSSPNPIESLDEYGPGPSGINSMSSAMGEGANQTGQMIQSPEEESPGGANDQESDDSDAESVLTPPPEYQ
ncbi:hypothetical protein FQR65_LT01621 [Abscondita terminalis]|nr:hypothetical protein FQR65_LT01621 [Abscondita terminalis]